MLIRINKLIWEKWHSTLPKDAWEVLQEAVQKKEDNIIVLDFQSEAYQKCHKILHPETPWLFNPTKVESISIPYKDWPMWAKGIKKFARKGHIGVGDTVEWMLLNGWISETLKNIGVPCGCAENKVTWNILYRY
jgi:hypothetical protein